MTRVAVLQLWDAICKNPEHFAHYKAGEKMTPEDLHDYLCDIAEEQAARVLRDDNFVSVGGVSLLYEDFTADYDELIKMFDEGFWGCEFRLRPDRMIELERLAVMYCPIIKDLKGHHRVTFPSAVVAAKHYLMRHAWMTLDTVQDDDAVSMSVVERAGQFFYRVMTPGLLPISCTYAEASKRIIEGAVHVDNIRDEDAEDELMTALISAPSERMAV